MRRQADPHVDFTAANILLRLANMDQWTLKELYIRLGVPQKQALPPVGPAVTKSSPPDYTVIAIDMEQVDPRWLSDEIMIIDFGIAFLTEHSSPNIGTPKSYCAPEFLFDEPRSISSDIWALGCTIFEIRTGSHMFKYKQRTPTRNQSIIAMVKLLGKLPDKWWDAWKDGHGWYNAQTRPGGQLSETPKGSLYSHILEIGKHDGQSPLHTRSSQRDSSLKHSSGQEAQTLSTATRTARLVALIEAITTSEAAEILERVNVSGSSLTGERSQTSGSGLGSRKDKSLSGSDQKESGSSNSKSNDVGSSEGIQINVSDTRVAGRPNGQLPSISDSEEGQPTVEPCSPDAQVFLEPAGSLITTVEARSLEDLLRSALAYLPAERAAASNIAKHPWFFDDFGARADVPNA